jgi:hypothetical protein
VIPERPAVDDTQRNTATARPRYEDITQDGRLVVTALMPGIGPSAWTALHKSAPDALESFRRAGILPILRRLVLTGEGGPLSVDVPITFDGCFQFAKEKDGDRLFLNMWMNASAPVATTFGPKPPRDAPLAPVGHLFVEHVITRPFAPPGERKVTRLDAPGFDTVPKHEHVFEPAEALTSGHTLAEAREISFGLMHTDSNQHVHSMVYPRVFEETVIEHLKTKSLLARQIELRWRKPFFAGDRAVIRLAMTGDRTVIGSFAPAGGSADKPSATIAMTLD